MAETRSAYAALGLEPGADAARDRAAYKTADQAASSRPRRRRCAPRRRDQPRLSRASGGARSRRIRSSSMRNGRNRPRPPAALVGRCRDGAAAARGILLLCSLGRSRAISRRLALAGAASLGAAATRQRRAGPDGPAAPRFGHRRAPRASAGNTRANPRRDGARQRQPRLPPRASDRAEPRPARPLRGLRRCRGPAPGPRSAARPGAVQRACGDRPAVERATALSDDYLAIDGRLDRIRLQVELALAPPMRAAAASATGASADGWTHSPELGGSPAPNAPLADAACRAAAGCRPRFRPTATI